MVALHDAEDDWAVEVHDRAANLCAELELAFTDQILPAMTEPQRKLAQTALAQAVPLKYYVSVKTRLLVGADDGRDRLAGLDRPDPVASDLTAFAKLADILATSPVAGRPAVQRLTETLSALAKPTPVKVLTMNYGQTPESVADFAAYAKDKAAEIELVRTTIPLILGILAATALVAAGVMAARDRRRPPPATTAAKPAGRAASGRPRLTPTRRSGGPRLPDRRFRTPVVAQANDHDRGRSRVGRTGHRIELVQ